MRSLKRKIERWKMERTKTPIKLIKNPDKSKLPGCSTQVLVWLMIDTQYKLIQEMARLQTQPKIQLTLPS